MSRAWVSAPPDPPLPHRVGRRVPAAVGALLLTLVGAVVALTLAPVSFVDAPPPQLIGPRPTLGPAATVGAVGSSAAVPAGPVTWPPWLVVLTQAAALVLGLALLYLLIGLLRRAVLALRRTRQTRRPPAAAPGPRVLLPEVPEELAGSDAQDRRAALLTGGSPRNAIVACWIDLEAATAAAGLARYDSETAAEYVARVLLAWDVDADALRQLSERFREARFSSHPVGETQRSAARAALQRVHADLTAAR